MRESISCLVPQDAVPLQVIEIGIEANLAQRNHNFDILEDAQFAIEEGRAISEFRGQRLVAGRRAANGRGNVTVHQLQSVVAMLGIWLRCEANLVQNGIHEFSRRIPRKGTAGTVGAVGPRRQSQHQHAGLGIAEPRYWPRPIFAIAIGTAPLTANLLAIGYQTRTLGAVHNFFIQYGESGSHPSHCSAREADDSLQENPRPLTSCLFAWISASVQPAGRIYTASPPGV